MGRVCAQPQAETEYAESISIDEMADSKQAHTEVESVNREPLGGRVYNYTR
jgi:hypothetical protein